MVPLPLRVLRAIQAAAIPADGLSVGDPFIRSTWRVSPSNLQAAAQSVIDGFNVTDPGLDVDLTADATATSRQKDVLATCALIVRARDIPGWNAMTLAQKKTATLNEADVWTNIRVFIERNL